MAAPNAARNDINKRLQEAIDGLRKDCLRVEIWASALTAFAQAIPKYEPNDDFLLGPERKKDD